MKFSDYELFVLEKPQLDCQDFESLLFQLVEEELPQSLELRLTEHVEECERCRQSLEDYRMTIDLARELRFEEQPDELPAGVASRLRSSLNQRLGLKMGK